MVQDQPGSPPTASTRVVLRKEEETGRWEGQEDSEDVEDLEGVEEVVRARTYSGPEHHLACNSTE